MKFKLRSLRCLFVISILFVSMAGLVAAQNDPNGPVFVPTKGSLPVTGANGLYCAGYIQSSPMATGNRIIGGSDEAEQFNYSQNDFVYINMGTNKGVNVGDVFSVVRPRGRVNSPWTTKDVGFFVEEVGALEVIRVKGEVSVAKIRSSCNSFLLGDLVQLTDKRTSPISENGGLDQFADPSGKAKGRILMGRDNAEMMARNSIAYVDLGAEDNVHVGDRLTLFRKLGKGNLMKSPEKEAIDERDRDYASLVYKGGHFSNQGSRKSGDKADGKAVTTYDAKRDRPELRKIVGEAIVLNVKERTATVVITRNAQEIHTGDWVEVQ